MDEGATLILNKVQGVSHGGGIQLAAGTDGFAAMERFLALLQGGPDGGPSVTPATLFDGVKMEPARSTLRRAAIVFAGRIPTDAEYDSIKTGGITSLRKAIRALMTGPRFHEFLIRSANDGLLTDREMGRRPLSRFGNFVDFTNQFYRLAKAAGGFNTPESNEELWPWHDNVQYGVTRAPLELIAHVAMHDLPYTEVLTADYIMANPPAAGAYGASTNFDDPQNVTEFKPSEIATYYRNDESKKQVVAFSEGHVLHITDPGTLLTDYPHAGVLNTTTFLARYPSTATNRNRARSRWTYYHFLGIDIEKSASRTTDPEALADTNNPTMNNPACTVCHSVLDPVAGAFQNYGDEGMYRDQWLGLDALDGHYKNDRGVEIPVEADSWSNRDALVWSLTLNAGANDLSVDFTNDFYDADTGDDGFLYLDSLRVVGPDGGTVKEVEFEDLGPPIAHWGPCGNVRDDPSGQGRHLALWNGGAPNCTMWLKVDAAKGGSYQVEVTAWADRFEGNEDWSDWIAEVAVSVNPYRQGDTWYRDMRSPGFDGNEAPNADYSLQWLAKRIVGDPRFAEASVKFWWPAVMGSDVVEPPSEGDPDFAGRLLASNAQSAEVERLAGAFRRGFGGGKRYNLKDLLTEIVLSKWFRANNRTDGNAARGIALANAGAKRLLTPEELSRKTLALTGFEWQRKKAHARTRPWHPQNWTNDRHGYGLLYGGINSDGIIKRGRDLTSIMAGVAQRLAAVTSCPVVLKDFYLLPAAERRLFGGIDVSVSPGSAGRLTTAAERTVRGKLVELHDKLLGVVVSPDSPDIDAALDLWVEVWLANNPGGQFPGGGRCDPHQDEHYFDGIADDIWREEPDENGWPKGWDWERMHKFLWDETDRSDPHGLARTWTVILAYLMTDPRYLHL